MRTRASWIVLAGIVLGAALIRMSSLDVPLERDEGEYAYTAKLLLEGIPPYVHAYNMKLPGIYIVYAAILACLGETPRDIHLGLLLANGLTIGLVALLGRRIADDVVGLGAAAAFALLSLSWTVQGAWANAEAFVLPFALGGLLLTLEGLSSGRLRTMILAGLLLGIAFLVKQHGVFFMFFAGATVAVEAATASDEERRLRLAQLASLGASYLFPYLLVCAAYWAYGRFDVFWFWTFEYARAYSGIIPLSEAPERFWSGATHVAAFGRALWLLALFGFGVLCSGRSPARARRGWTLGFLALSLGALAPGLYFRPHYFVLMLPAAALLIGIGGGALGDLMAKKAGTRASNWGTAGTIGLAVLLTLYTHRAPLFQWTPTQQTRSVYGFSPFPESTAVARFLNERSVPEDRVAILGSEPQIPFYAGLRSASGYLYMYPLMEDHPFASRMQLELIREIEASAPRFIVFVNVPSSWQRRPETETTLFEWMDRYIREFRLVGRAAIRLEGTKFYREHELSQSSVCAENCIEIFERLAP